jgi:hypothetical protein
MKKTLGAVMALTLVVALLAPLSAQAQSETQEPGGMKAFFVGCCLGLRVGTEWNEGADVHWREWGTIIPVAGAFIGIWNGMDCAKGLTAHQFAEEYGTNWY